MFRKCVQFDVARLWSSPTRLTSDVWLRTVSRLTASRVRAYIHGLVQSINNAQSWDSLLWPMEITCFLNITRRVYSQMIERNSDLLGFVTFTPSPNWSIWCVSVRICTFSYSITSRPINFFWNFIPIVVMCTLFGIWAEIIWKSLLGSTFQTCRAKRRREPSRTIVTVTRVASIMRDNITLYYLDHILINSRWQQRHPRRISTLT